MNRVRKSKSLLIKQIMRSSKWSMTYKEAKRELRRRNRRAKRAAEFYMKHIHCRSGPAPKLPGDPNFVIDETPVEEPTEMWPKENPYLKKETYAEN